MSEPVEVEYIIKPEDILDFFGHFGAYPHRAWRDSSATLWHYGTALIALLITVGVFVFGGRLHVISRFALLMTIVPIMMVPIMLPKLYKRRLRKRMRQGAFARDMGWHRLTITPDACVFEDAYSTLTMKWAGVELIVVTEDHAFFFVSDRSALILPRRPFAKEQAFLDFIETAEGYRRGAPVVIAGSSNPVTGPEADGTGFRTDQESPS